MRAGFARLIVVLLLALATTAVAQEKTPAEMAALKAAAEGGKAVDQLAYAQALGSQSRDARAWAQKAADQGLAEAWFWLGYTTTGDTIPYYAKAAELGYDKAFGYLLDDLLFSAAEKADVVQAKKFGDLARARSIKVGYDTRESLETIDRCFEAGVPVIPPADLPTEAERKALESKECVPYLTPPAGPPDYRKYRACLLSETPVENRWLAEVYANGWSVQRNPKLALALVCHGSDVPGELIGMVKTLYDTRDVAKLEKPFEFCAHVTSGRNQGVCAIRFMGADSDVRDVAWSKVTARWSTPQRAAFDTVRKAATEFFGARAHVEMDQSGTGHIAYAISEAESLEDALLESVRAFEAGKLPARAALATVDAKLNAYYSSIMRREMPDTGTISKDGIRETQRKWLTYRDAWASFAARRYPARSAAEWKAWLTAARIAQLKSLFEP